MTQKMIAYEFGISINTVGNLAANAYKKLGVQGSRRGATGLMRTVKRPFTFPIGSLF